MDVNVLSGGGNAAGVSHGVRTRVPASPAGAPAARPQPEVVDRVDIASRVNTGAESALGAPDPGDIRSGTRFRIDDATERIVVQILNANNEVIRQLPPEEALRIAARFREVTGLLFDRQI